MDRIETLGALGADDINFPDGGAGEEDVALARWVQEQRTGISGDEATVTAPTTAAGPGTVMAPPIAQDASVIDDARDVYDDLTGGGNTGDPRTDLAERALRELLESITFLSEVSPPITVTAAEIISRSKERPDPNAPSVVQETKPTIVIRLRRGLGTRVIAPGGRADPNAWKTVLAKFAAVGGAAVVGLFVGGALVGYLVGRPKKAIALSDLAGLF